MSSYKLRNREREQIELLKQRIKQLKKQQQSLAYNGVETEKQIRERMGLHAPGEKVLFLKPEEEVPKPDATPAAAPAIPDPDALPKPELKEQAEPLNKSKSR